MAVPIPPPIPAPISPPFAPLLKPPITAPVPAAVATVFAFSPVWLSCRMVPSSSFIEVFSAPGTFSTEPGSTTV